MKIILKSFDFRCDLYFDFQITTSKMILILNHLYLADLILFLKSSKYDNFANLCSLYTLENMEGFCRLHLHSPPSFRRPPTNILSIIVGLWPIIVVHRQIIVDLRPILSSTDNLLSVSDLKIVDRRPFSATADNSLKIFLRSMRFRTWEWQMRD